MTHALLIIDIQRDYFPGGAYPLVGPEDAARAASTVLDAYRAAGAPVVHVQHVWDAPDAAFMKPGTDGVEIHPSVAPTGDEPVVTKAFPNSFIETDLETQLRDRGIDTVVVAGMMTSMCVDSTVRAGAERGFTMRVIHDACAAPDLALGTTAVPGASVHAAFVAALADGFAEVVSSEQAVASLARTDA